MRGEIHRTSKAIKRASMQLSGPACTSNTFTEADGERLRRLKAFASTKVRIRRLWAGICISLALAAVLSCLCCPLAHADVGVVLDESMGKDMDRITGTGHSAVYLSRVCTDSPVKLRLCRSGEQGSVISTYMALGEDQRFEWNAVPLSVYLYGVDDPRDRPLFGSPKIKRFLEQQYREKHLGEYCTTRFCQTSDDAEWEQMVGANFVRGIYIFVAETTEQQDLKFISEFNSLPNVNHFNGVTHNCADFTRRVINSYFPHAVSPDYINDFGMTSPKAVARSFTHYALRHPEMHFRVLHYAQLPGTIKRSREVRKGTEQLFHSKLVLPMLLFAEHTLPVMAAFYVFTGRFNPERESEEYPTAAVTDTSREARLALAESQRDRARQLESLAREERSEVVGTSAEWKLYRKAFRTLLSDNVTSGDIPNRRYLKRAFRQLDAVGTPVADPSGALWLEITAANGPVRLGLTASNVLAPGSDSRQANELLLARVGQELKSPKHGRETMLEFKQDWNLLQTAVAANPTPQPSALAVSKAAGTASSGGNQ